MPATASIVHESWDFSDYVLKTRLLRAIEDGASRYPVHRSLRCAARAQPEALFDDLALGLGLRAQRLSDGELLLDGDGVFVNASGGRKAHYASLAFQIWAESVDKAEAIRASIVDRIGAAMIRGPMFSIDWHFLTARGALERAAIEEMADDVLLDEAYPALPQGVAAFVGAYLDASETVLVLQGPPGTGKTRLIRAILGELSRRHDGSARALYTGDTKTLQSDEVFVRFLTGDDDVFIVEDADHVLKPRARGNADLHRFLTVADGVVRAQGRKIVFSTNLPNLGDLDDALIRPGRCFARVDLRKLARAEIAALVARLCPDAGRADRASAALADHETATIAEVYRAVARSA